MRTTVPARVFVAVLGVSLYGAALAGQQPPSSAGPVHEHDAMDHGAASASPADAQGHYLTVNVALSDGGIEPSSVFVPAGQPVQLMLRNRGTTEHHYRVMDLTPDELWWLSQDAGAADEGASDEAHDHHSRAFARSRTTSTGGITPSGREVHGYVSPARVVDVVLFTATQTGTFVVQCDLHPEEAGSLTVFGGQPQPGAQLSAASGQALRAALTRDLGRVDYPGASGVQLEATYAPAEYESQLLGGPAAMDDAADRERHIAFLLTERIHTANLPRTTSPPDLFVSGNHLPLIDSKVITDSVHHRATSYLFARDEGFGQGHQVMTLRVASGQEATWHLPLLLPDVSSAGAAPAGLLDQWGLILALLGGMVAAMWPCLFQLTVYFIPALAGVAMQGGSSSAASRGQVFRAAFYFILGFTIVYTATGALIGYAAQRFGDTSQFESWQRYIGVAAGVVVIGLALRVAAKVRAPLVCRMPILSNMARSKKPASRTEMMVAGLAFATGCMTCFGSALVVGMVVYIGLAQSALYGALVLFLFSLGMGIPLVIAAVAMARALPLLLKLESAVPWMGLVSAVLMGGFGVLLISGNYMIVSEWTYRVASGSATLPHLGNALAVAAVVLSGLGLAGWLAWKMRMPGLRTG